MAEISHVRFAVPDQGMLSRILREGGAQQFPQWMYAEPGDEPRILWWGVRGAATQLLDLLMVTAIVPGDHRRNGNSIPAD